MTRPTFTRAQRIEIAERDGWVCRLCGGPVEKNSAWQADHIVPVAFDGPTTIDNGQLAHFECHRKKTAAQDVPEIAKADRIRKKREGRRPSKKAQARARMDERRKDGLVAERQTTDIDG